MVLDGPSLSFAYPCVQEIELGQHMSWVTASAVQHVAAVAMSSIRDAGLMVIVLNIPWPESEL